MYGLKQDLLNVFNVELILPDSIPIEEPRFIDPNTLTLGGPAVTLRFKEEHTKVINANLAMYSLDFFETQTEKIALKKEWIPSFIYIERISILNSNPYEIEIQAVKPLIYAFVLVLLEW